MLYKKLLLILVVALASCKQVKQAKNLANCDFDYSGSKNTEVSGVNLDNRKSVYDFSFLEVTTLLGALGSGDVPLNTNILVDIKNNSEKVAALNKIEWQAFIEDTQITTGTFEERIEVNGGGAKQISIPVSANIAELLSGESRKDVMNFIQGLMGDGDQKSSVKLKLKPFFKVGKSYVPYPGFINVEHEMN